MLTTILPNPGVVREGTAYTAEGTYWDCNGIRWRKGLPEQIGGWARTLGGRFLGVARKLHDWATVDGEAYMGVGTTFKLYVNDSGTYHDVTPLSQDAISLAADPITTANGTALVEVAITAHGAVVGDYVTLSGAATTNGIPDTDLNAEHRVVGVPDANTVQVVVDTAATSTGTGGGASVVAELQINVGLDEFVAGVGWGAGPWGGGSWGGSVSLSPANQLRIWSLDNFGDDLLACVRTGGIYYWDESAGASVRAVRLPDLPRRTVTLDANPLATVNGTAVITVQDIADHGVSPGDEVTISGAATTNGIPDTEINATHIVTATPTPSTFTITVSTNATSTGAGGGSAVQVAYVGGEFSAPLKGMQVMVSPTARHVVVFGANPRGETDPDPLLVRWSSSENAADWLPRDDNSAGGQRISAGSVFMGALRTRQEILIWTDAGMVSMRYVGTPLVFSFNEIENGVGMISPNAAVNAGGLVYFMDRGGFFIYDGSVRRLPCSLRDYVFSDLDLDQAFKIHVGSNIDHSEVVWFYPSLSGDGNVDSYVKFNYDENLWDFGRLPRSAWTNAFTKDNPVAAKPAKTALGTNPISVTSASQTLTVTAPGHGLSVGDEVILQGLGTIGGIDALVINTQWPVATVVDEDTFTIELPDTATGSETGGGSLGELLAPSYLLAHEIGFDDEGSQMDSFIESGDIDIEDGHHFWFVNRIIPDVVFRGTSDPLAAVRMMVRSRNFPAQDKKTYVDFEVTPGTTQKHVRLRARQIALRIESAGTGFGWRLGKTRLDVRQDGRR